MNKFFGVLLGVMSGFLMQHHLIAGIGMAITAYLWAIGYLFPEEEYGFEKSAKK